MKFFVYIFFFFSIQVSFGQIIYKPVFINQCKKEVEASVIWNLSDSTGFHGTEDFTPIQVKVPKSGTYNLNIESDDPILINIPNQPLVIDTIFLQKIRLETYLIGPPYSEYYDCQTLANGKIVDNYSNGSIRIRGTFEQGQPTDSVFSYYRSGQISQIFIPLRKKWKQTTYFPNGQIKSVNDTKERYYKDYYQSGQLHHDALWSKNNRSRVKTYDENGILQSSRNHNKIKRFNTKNVLVQEMKRRETRVLKRIFTFNKNKSSNRYYKYVWKSYDSKGIIQREVLFSRYSSCCRSTFPDTIVLVRKHEFDKVILYKKGKEHTKIDFESVPKAKEYEQKMVLYKKVGDKWIRREESESRDIHDYIIDFRDQWEN